MLLSHMPLQGLVEYSEFLNKRPGFLKTKALHAKCLEHPTLLVSGLKEIQTLAKYVS